VPSKFIFHTMEKTLSYSGKQAKHRDIETWMVL
jgi:hypothetical protein